MSSPTTIRRTAAATAIFAALTFNAAHANDIAYFRDVLKPNGHARNAAAKLADGLACGASADHTIHTIIPVFQKCMSARGWVLDHYAPDGSPVHGTTVNFTDVRGDGQRQPRSNASLQADTRACAAGGRDLESTSFKRCMAGRGWQFILTQYAPAPRYAAMPRRPTASQWDSWASSGSSSSQSASDLDDQIRHDDERNRTLQATSDAINAAIQATNDANAAAAAQMQNDLIRANEPVQQQ